MIREGIGLADAGARNTCQFHNQKRGPKCPWAIMNALVRFRHDLEEIIGSEKLISMNRNGLENQYTARYRG